MRIHLSECVIPHLNQHADDFTTGLRGRCQHQVAHRIVQLTFTEHPLSAHGHTASKEQSQDTHSELRSEGFSHNSIPPSKDEKTVHIPKNSQV